MRYKFIEKDSIHYRIKVTISNISMQSNISIIDFLNKYKEKIIKRWVYIINNKIIKVQNIKVNVVNIEDNDYICIYDFGKYKEGKSEDIIRNWLRNRITLEFLWTWESIYNPNFNSVEFDGFRKKCRNSYFYINYQIILILETMRQLMN